MKKILDWLKSPASDFALFVVLVVLLNLVCRRAYLRFDLTAPKSYSLSKASRQAVKTLTEPLSIKVYFSDNLTAPYSNVQQYLSDLLVEYKGAANKNFSYSFVDMGNPKNQREASDCGLHQIQIQEVKNSEIGFKQAFMGLAIFYADEIDTIDAITSTASLEYTLTSKISSMIQKADALAGIGENGKISLTLYKSDELSAFGINGFDQIDEKAMAAFNAVNKRSQGRIEFKTVSPSAQELQMISEKYGAPLISWRDKNGETGSGALALVLEHGEKFRLVPLSLQSVPLFGYMVGGLDDLEQSLSDNLTSLVSTVTQIAYSTGNGERALRGENGRSVLESLAGDMYTFNEVNLSEGDIPSNVAMLMIAGPKSRFSDDELYKIDQFVMKGGNVMFLLDPFQEEGGGYYQMPSYAPIDTGLSKLLDAYGVKVPCEYVFDEKCFVNYSQYQQYGALNLYWAPMLSRGQLSQRSDITRNLGSVIFLQCAPIDTEAASALDGVSVTALAKSSPGAWTKSTDIQLNPLMVAPPSDKSQKSQMALAVLLDGKFKSAFQGNPAQKNDGDFSTNAHVPKSVQASRIFIAGTSEIAGEQLIDEGGKEPVAIMMRNAIDCMNGNDDLCAMRVKGLSLNELHGGDTVLAVVARFFNQFGLAVLVVAAGLVVWRKREKRRRAIHAKYNPNDARYAAGDSK